MILKGLKMYFKKDWNFLFKAYMIIFACINLQSSWKVTEETNNAYCLQGGEQNDIFGKLQDDFSFGFQII